MKRYLLTLVSVFSFVFGANAMDYETAREEAYYLTDKMAYELNLNEQQYNDAYEINLDYLLSINTEADIYSSYWDYRNADLRYILYDWQWRTFMGVDYFYRPVSWFNGGWYFPIFRYYTHGYFFYDRPGIFWDYRGAHGRAHFMGRSFYDGRRPEWNGGFRGAGRDMVGHPNGRDGGRYGTPGGGRGGNMGGSMGRGGMQNGNGGRGGMNSGTQTGTTHGATMGRQGTIQSGRSMGRTGDNNVESRGSVTRGTGNGYSRGTDNMRSSSRSTVSEGRGSVGRSSSSSMSSSSSRSAFGGNRSMSSGSGMSRGSVGGSTSRGSVGGGMSRGSSSMGGSSSRGSSMSSGGSRGSGSSRGSSGGGSRGGSRGGGGRR